MIELYIITTGKSYDPKDQWHTIDEKQPMFFADLIEAKKWCGDYYGTSKKINMYRDENGENKHIGYVFSFRASDNSHYPVEHWLQQDWVEFREINSLDLGGK